MSVWVSFSHPLQAIAMRFPSLPALRAFEAAARLGSFRAAAETLHLSPTAISHHIRGLETRLGMALFVRETRHVRLTEAGRMLSDSATRAFGELETTLALLEEKARRLTLSTTPAFATLWLAPRLDGFQRCHPALEIRVLSSTQRSDLHRDRHIDLAVRYAPADMPVSEGIPLLQDAFAAFASPEYATRLGATHQAELIATRWESDQLPQIDWSMWLAAAGESAPASSRTQTFAHEQEVVQAGLAGRGLILVSELLVRPLVARGWLIPWQPRVTLPGHVWHVVPGPLAADRPGVSAFMAWLRAELPLSC